ncbi:MAG: TraB/GumN family protein, partial [Bacteroidota bacterium]|nr:TraB/GumN family protein [Bacteroidota bacterium]
MSLQFPGDTHHHFTISSTLMTASLRNFFFFLFGSTIILSSCNTTKSAVDDQKPLPSALLWKIEHPDMKQPSYLFGTIHMIPKEDFFYPSGLEEAYDKSNQVVFEIDLDDMSGIGSLMGMLSNILMKDGMTLNKLLSPSEYNEVAAYFEEMGLPMFMLSKVKPMFLSMLAEVNINPEEMESGEIISYEMEIYDRAQKDKKTVSGLETMDYQMSLFDSIDYKDQALMLLDAVRGTTGEGDAFDETVELYKNQDIG